MSLLTIYDLGGRLVKSLVTGESWQAGSHSVIWDGTDDQGNVRGSGVYLYRVKAEGFNASQMS